MSTILRIHAQRMSVGSRNSIEYILRTRVLVCLLGVLGMAYVNAGNYLRVSADFSYAHDVTRTKADAAAMTGMELSDALQIVGGGMAEAHKGSNGFAPAVGVGFRYTNKLWIVDAGLGFEYRYTVNKLQDIIQAKAPAVDETGMDYLGYHTWSGRKATWQHAGVHIPVMAGIQWKSLYAMVGVKANIDIWGSSVEKGAYTLQADYERYMNVLGNIAGHGLVEQEPYKMPKVSASMAWDLRACAEIGYCINPQGGQTNYKKKMQPIYYIGAFAEYAFVGTKDTYLPVLAGVRLTALLPLPEKHFCNCLGY